VNAEAAGEKGLAREALGTEEDDGGEEEAGVRPDEIGRVQTRIQVLRCSRSGRPLTRDG
jgi:hypothetical protein